MTPGRPSGLPQECIDKKGSHLVKRIRIAAGLMLAAALLTISFAIPAASGHEGAKVAVNSPAPFCASLSELLVANGSASAGAGYSSVGIEIVGSPNRRNPTSPWQVLPPLVELWNCDGPGTRTPLTDIASAP